MTLHTVIEEAKKEACPECKGNGWVEGSRADHGCDGSDEMCQSICPIQVQTQEGCGYCQGTGLVDIEKTQTPEEAYLEALARVEDFARDRYAKMNDSGDIAEYATMLLDLLHYLQQLKDNTKNNG